eukprot:TRINITY_DN22745_c0_g1_i1.p1 TRINITY_DN22745_c0_g1~~TRINITY_DN22745_c0_g1_i1.p1  ORF type:complete len:376 (+),score=67.10 TRINITY_DN22745_c0_g1_i1:34-1128(+)
MGDLLLKKLRAKDNMNIEIWEEIESSLEMPLRVLNTISWDTGILDLRYQNQPITLNLGPIWEKRPEKLFLLEAQKMKTDEYVSLLPLIKKFELTDLSNPTIKALLEKWLDCLDSVFLYMTGIKNRFISEFEEQRKILSMFGVPESFIDKIMETNLCHLLVRFRLKEGHSVFLKQHGFSLYYNEFPRKNWESLEILIVSITHFYTFETIERNKWNLKFTTCTNNNAQPLTEYEMISKSPDDSVSKLDGTCVVTSPRFPLKIHVSGGDNDWKFGVILEDKQLVSENGYLIKPNNEVQEGKFGQATQHRWTYGVASDGNYTLDFRESCLYLMKSDNKEVLIFSNIPRGNYFFYLEMIHGPTRVKLLN